MLWINNLLVVYAGLVLVELIYRLFHIKSDKILHRVRKQKIVSIAIRIITLMLIAISVNDLFINEEWQYLFWAVYGGSFYW